MKNLISWSTENDDKSHYKSCETSSLENLTLEVIHIL